MIDGEVIEVKPPHKLVQTLSLAVQRGAREAKASRASPWKSNRPAKGFCRVTVTHDIDGCADDGRGATHSKFSEQGGGGWNWILSDLKSLLETGKTMS